ncbi:MAG: hypothetical protein JEY97_04815 [Bacteroidales bacterium]|nr:hypothetical protein [Bacteroidales bacterium]
MQFTIRSVGLGPKSDRQLREKDINWADLIFFMEQGQWTRISGKYRNLELRSIE